jgi:hypothetical protein
MCKALFQWLAASNDQLLSQLPLQLLLLAYCIPTSSELEGGSEEACAFVDKAVAAVSEASKLTPGQLTFAEVQLSFVLTSVPPLVICADMGCGATCRSRLLVMLPHRHLDGPYDFPMCTPSSVCYQHTSDKECSEYCPAEETLLPFISKRCPSYVVPKLLNSGSEHL